MTKQNRPLLQLVCYVFPMKISVKFALCLLTNMQATEDIACERARRNGFSQTPEDKI